MIDLVWNFPLLAGQNEEWQGYLRRAVEGLRGEDVRELRPSFRGCDGELRERAARWLSVDLARVWLVCGGHHGTLVSLMAAGLAGKAVAVESVTYMGILEQARMLGIRAVGCSYDDEGMLPEALRKACVDKGLRAVFLMPTVQNPLGCVAGLERRKALVEVAREFDLVVIEDDAYGFMEADAPANYAVLAPERTFYVRGLSKSYAPATRTGFLIAPERFAGEVEGAIKNTSTGTSIVHNAASLLMIEDGTLERVIEKKRAEGAVRNALGRQILGAAAGAGARCAWHLWVRLPEGLTGVEAQRICAEKGVLVSGAAGFVAPGSEVPGALRVGMGGEVDRARVMEGLLVVESVVKH